MKKKCTVFSFLLIVLLLSSCSFFEKAELPPTMTVSVSEDHLLLSFIGKDDQTVLVTGKHLFRPRFSPDGKNIYYNNSNDIFCIPISGGTPVLAAANATLIGFDKNNRMISYSSTNGVRAFDIQTGITEVLFPVPENLSLSSAVQTQDASRIAIQRVKNDAGFVFPFGLTIFSEDSPDKPIFYSQDICSREGLLTTPFAWSSDDNTVLVLCHSQLNDEGTLYFLSLDNPSSDFNSDNNIIIDIHTKPSYSYDGSTVAFPAYESTKSPLPTVCVINLDSLSSKYIPTGESKITGTALSPDGSKVFYTTDESDGGLYVFASKVTVCLSAGSPYKQFFSPVVAAQGQKVWFVSLEEKYVNDLDRDGNVIGTHVDTVTRLSSSPVNTAGEIETREVISAPDGIYTNSWRDMFDVFDPISFENQKVSSLS